MGSVGDADGLIEMFVNHDTALCERDAKVRRADLKDSVLVGNGIILVNGPFGFDRENKIEIQMGRKGDKRRTFLLGRFGEPFVKFRDVMLSEKTVGFVFGLDVVEAEFVREPTLKRLVHPLASSSGLRRVGWDHPDAQFVQGSADLREMAFLDFVAGLGSEEEVACAVGVQRAKDTPFCDTIPEENHALAGIFLIDEAHFIDAAGGIVKKC